MKFIPLIFLAMALSAHAENLHPSVYYITQSSTDRENCSTMKNLIDSKSQTLAQVCKDFYKKCVLEGTCLITQGDKNFILNYSETIQDIPRFTLNDATRCPFGVGVDEICLDPFYTVAADLKYHKAGDVLYVDKLKGLKLPNNDVHNGYVIVRDRGGGIKGPNRFDFFTGIFRYTDPKNTMSQEGFSSTLNSYKYQKIWGSKADEVRKDRNFPLLPLPTTFGSLIGK